MAISASNPITEQSRAYFNSVLTKMGPAYLQGYKDTQFRRHWLLASLLAGGGVKREKHGGTAIMFALAIGENPTVQFGSPYAAFKIQAAEDMTTAQFPWAGLKGSITVMDADVHRCVGKEKIISFLDPKFKQFSATVKKRLAVAIGNGASGRTDGVFASGSATSIVEDSTMVHLGLRDAITSAGAASIGDSDTTCPYPDYYGGLAPQANTALGDWSSPVVNNANTKANLVQNLNHARGLAENSGTDAMWDLVVTDQVGREVYEALLAPNIRYNDLKVGDSIFKGVEFGGKPMIFDEDVKPFLAAEVPATAWTGTADTAATSRYYGVALDSFVLVENPDWNLDQKVDDDWRAPEDAKRKSSLVHYEGQIICRERRANWLVRNGGH